MRVPETEIHARPQGKPEPYKQNVAATQCRAAHTGLTTKTPRAQRIHKGAGDSPAVECRFLPNLIVLRLMPQQMPHRVDLPRVVSHMKRLILHEISPRAPLPRVRIVLTKPRDKRLRRLMHPQDVLNQLSHTQRNLVRTIHLRGVVT